MDPRFKKFGMVGKMVGLSSALLVLLCLLLAPGVAGATPGQWRWHGIGLSGETIQSLAVDPTNSSLLHAGTASNGVYKSIDGGGSWNKTNAGLTDMSITSLAIDPVTPATVYAGGWTGGLFRSLDGGVTWNVVLATHKVTAITTISSPILYAGTLDAGVFKSTDGGVTWSASNTGLTRLFVEALVVDPITPTTLYAGTLIGGVFKSTNSGGSWSAVNSGLTSLSIKCLAINPVTPATLYVAISAGLFKSIDGGVTWKAANTGLTTVNINRVAIDPVTPATLYAGTSDSGVFKSIDAGSTWAPYSTTLTSVNVQALAIGRAVSVTTVYAGTVGGLFVLFQQPTDTTQPTGGITLNGAAVYTTTPAITVNLSAADAVGVTGYYLSTAATAPAAGAVGWTTITESTSYRADVPYTLPSGDGAKTVYVWYKDSEGNVSTAANAGITLDTTPPVDGALAAIAGKAQVALSWSGFSDASSGIAAYTLVYDTVGVPSSCSSGTQIYTGAGSSFTHTGLTNGTPYYYLVCATDKVGYVSSGAGAGATPDATAPTSGISINGGGSATLSTAVTLTLSATDAVGVTGYYLSTLSTAPLAGAAGWSPITSTTVYSATLPYQLSSGDGVKTVYVWYRDLVGNVSGAASAQIILDTVPPINGAVTTIPGNAQIMLNWSGFSDAGSGIAGYTLVYDTVTIPSSCAAGTQVYTGSGSSYTHAGLANTLPLFYRLCATDNAGNISTGVTAVATPDGTPPSGGISIDGGISATAVTSASLSLSATDDVGVTGYYLSTVATPPAVTAAGWVPVTSIINFSATLPFTLSSGDGVKTVYVWYRDLVGNVSAAASDQIILDTVPPLNGVVTATPGDAQIVLNWNGFSDSGSGIAAYTLVYDTVALPVSCTAGTQLYSDVGVSFTHTALARGIPYYYRVCATDMAGNLSTGSSVVVIPDVTAPMGGISINGGALFTPSSSVTVTLSATDDGGVTGYYLSTGATPPLAGAVGWIAVASTTGYSATIPFSLSSGDGAKTVYVWYKDVAGNVSVAAGGQITLDTTPPANGTVTATPGDGVVTLSWSGYSDAGSGIAGYTLVYGTGGVPASCKVGTQLYTGVDTSFVHTGLGKGIYYYRVCATDNVGNISSGAGMSALPDIIAPTGGISINGGALFTSNVAVTLALSATDDGGVTGYYLSTVATPPTAAAVGWVVVASTLGYSANLPFTLSSGDGVKKVYAWYKDLAGNVSVTAGYQITLDTISPVNGVVTATPGDALVTLSWTGYSDLGSGIAGYTLVYGAGSAPLSCKVGTQLYTGVDTSFQHVNLVRTTPYYYRLCATDNAGNLSTGAIVSAIGDINAPVGGISVNGGATFTSSATVTLALSASDDGGVTGYYLSTVATPPTAGATGWVAVTSTLTYGANVPYALSSGDGVKTLYVWYKDLAGNVSAAAGSQITLDTTPPLNGFVTAIPGDGVVSLSWSGYSDVGSGIAGYTLVYSTGGIPASCQVGTQIYSGVDTSFVHAGLGKGAYYYRVCATDNAGNISSGAGMGAIADITAPIGGLSINGGALFTSSTTVTVALSATDDGGVIGYYLSTIATPPTAVAAGWIAVTSTLSYSANLPYTLSSGDGVKKLYAWYKDLAGNVSATAGYQITFDATLPVNGIVTATPGDALVTLSWTGYSDPGSGIAGYTLVYGTVAAPLSCKVGTQLYSGVDPSFVHGNLSRNITYYYRVCATDNAGNLSTGAIVSAIGDITAPSGGISINGGASFTSSATVTLALSATDDGGVTGYYLSTAASPPTATAAGWITVASTLGYTANVSYLLSSGDGAKTVYAWYKDLAGNVSTAAGYQITLDTTPPLNGLVTAIPGDGVVSLSWSGYSDVGSGIAGYTLVYGTGGIPVSCQVGTQIYSGVDTSFVHSGLAKGTYYYRVCATDNAGNISSGASMSALPDITAPIGGILINGGAPFTTSSAVTLALTATDDGGVIGYYLSTIATPPTAVAVGWIAVPSTLSYSVNLPFTLGSGDGVKKLYVWYKDLAGNVSATAGSQITVDATPPVNGVVTATPGDTVVTLGWTGYSDPGSGIAGYTVVYSTVSAPLSCKVGTQLYSGADTSFVHGNLSRILSYYYRVCATDNAGNLSTGATISAMADITAPVGALSINSGATSSTSPTVTLALSATDDGGVTGYYLSTVATPPVPGAAGWVVVAPTTGYSANVPFTLSSGDGAKTLYVWYRDLAGNVSAVAGYQITLDTTPPVNGLVTVIPGDGVVTLSWSGYSDVGSGIAGYTLVYSTGGIPASCQVGTQIYFGVDTSFVHTGLAKGTYYYRVCATDNAGNISSGASMSALPDITAPTGGILINGGATFATSSVVTLALTATDDGGVIGYYLSTVATPPTAATAGWIPVPSTLSYNANLPFTLSSGDGVKKLYVWYKDLAGNVSATAGSQIILDATLPVNGVVTATPGDTVVTLGWTGYSDPGSGIAGYTVVYGTVSAPASCMAGTPLFTGTTTSFVHGNLSRTTSYYYRVCATDNAGNLSTGTIAGAIADVTAPVGVVSINGGAALVSNTAVTISLSAGDDGGVTGYYLSTTGTAPVATAAGWVAVTSTLGYSATVPYVLSSGDGVKTVYAWYKDLAGNVSVAASSQITLDATPPVNGVLTVIPGDTNIALSWNGYSDPGSGIAVYTVVYGTGSAPLSCTTGTLLFTGVETSYVHGALLRNIPYYYRVCATDNAGNLSSGSIAGAIPDITAPVGGISINGGATWALTPTVTVALSAADDGGVTGYYLSTVATPPKAGAAGWVPVASVLNYSVNLPFTLSSGDGVKTIYVWYKDVAGNVSAAAGSSILLDTTPPVDGVLTATSGDTLISLNWKGYSDTGSGIVGYTVVYGTGGAPASCLVGTQLYIGADTSFTHVGLTNGATYYYRVCAVDAAGYRSVGATAGAMPQAPVTLTGAISGNGGGALNSITPGVTFSCSSGSCSTTFGVGTALILRASPDTLSLFTGWSGACTGTGDCSLTMDSDKSATATFGSAPKVKVGVKEFTTIQAAYDDVSTVNNSVIMLLNGTLPGAFTADRSIVVTLQGGYNAAYGAVTGETVLKGVSVFKSGTVVVNNVAVR